MIEGANSTSATYRGFHVLLTPLSDRSNVLWRVFNPRGKPGAALTRDIAPDQDQARTRAYAFIDKLKEERHD